MYGAEIRILEDGWFFSYL